jgi:long-chain acyl-CoA synthetase
VNLAHLIDGHPDDAVALITRGRPVTYGELRRRVGGVRGGLVSLGLEPGDRVALVCANNLPFVVGYLAVLGAGCVAVPLNPSSPPAELQAELLRVGVRAVLCGPKGAKAVARIDRGTLPELAHVIAPAAVELEATTHLEDLEAHEPAPIVEREPDDVAVLVFTAGTAGSPKAAMLTHANLLTNIRQVQAIPARTMYPDDVSLGVLPLFHVFGLNVVLGVTLSAGATVVLVERFDPVSAVETIRNHGCTVVAGAPPMWLDWSALRGVDADSFATVRVAVSGASRLPEEAYLGMRERFGVEVSEGYGLTEATAVVTTSVGDDDAMGSIGGPVPGIEIRLVDAEGHNALVGDAGEIWVRGPNVFAGYWDDPEATAAALTPDGWLRTGDVAVADEKGNLRIVDRAKDLVIVSGFNVYPAEVETVLLDHPGVEDVAVIGVEHPHSGEAVKAYVVARPDQAVEEDELIEFCAVRLARYKCPSKVMFVSEIPRGMAGKVLRRALR